MVVLFLFFIRVDNTRAFRPFSINHNILTSSITGIYVPVSQSELLFCRPDLKSSAVCCFAIVFQGCPDFLHIYHLPVGLTESHGRRHISASPQLIILLTLLDFHLPARALPALRTTPTLPQYMCSFINKYWSGRSSSVLRTFRDTSIMHRSLHKVSLDKVYPQDILRHFRLLVLVFSSEISGVELKLSLKYESRRQERRASPDGSVGGNESKEPVRASLKRTRWMSLCHSSAEIFKVYALRLTWMRPLYTVPDSLNNALVCETSWKQLTALGTSLNISGGDETLLACLISS